MSECVSGVCVCLAVFGSPLNYSYSTATDSLPAVAPDGPYPTSTTHTSTTPLHLPPPYPPRHTPPPHPTQPRPPRPPLPRAIRAPIAERLVRYPLRDVHCEVVGDGALAGRGGRVCAVEGGGADGEVGEVGGGVDC